MISYQENGVEAAQTSATVTQASLARTVISHGRTVASLALTVFAGPQAVPAHTVPKRFPDQVLTSPSGVRGPVHIYTASAKR